MGIFPKYFWWLYGLDIKNPNISENKALIFKIFRHILETVQFSTLKYKAILHVGVTWFSSV